MRLVHSIKTLLVLTGISILSFPALALDVKITPDLEVVDVRPPGGQSTQIQRIQDQNNVITGSFAKTSRKCPPFCIQPMRVGPGVSTVGEVEFIEFIQKKLNNGRGVVIDARTEKWHARGTIPGSINLPFTLFTLPADDPRLIEALGKLGVRPAGESEFSVDRMLAKIGLASSANLPDWDFTNAKDLLLWCNGIWCGQSPRAIRGLTELGYPANKLYYYRGGMQVWQTLGLSTVIPN